MACSTACPTRDCPSYGACLRRKSIQIDQHSLTFDLRLESRKDHTLERYRQLRADGHEPGSIKKSNLDRFEKTQGL